MDKNTITGLVLIAILLVGFSFLTQIYAKITAQKISQDMETLSHKLEDMEKNICRAI